MKLVLSLLAVVGFATSLHAGSLDNWEKTYRNGVEVPSQKPLKDYSSFAVGNQTSKSISATTLTTGIQSGQGFSGSGIRSVR